MLYTSVYIYIRIIRIHAEFNVPSAKIGTAMFVYAKSVYMHEWYIR